MRLLQGAQEVQTGALTGRDVLQNRRAGPTTPRRRSKVDTGRAALVRKIVDRIERDNVRMLKPRQRQMFATAAGCQLQHNRPIRQRRLPRQKNTTVSAAAQFLQQTKVAQCLACRWKVRRAELRRHQLMAIEQRLHLSAPLRKAAQEVVGVEFRAGLRADRFPPRPVPGPLRVVRPVPGGAQVFLGCGSIAVAPGAAPCPRPGARSGSDPCCATTEGVKHSR